VNPHLIETWTVMLGLTLAMAVVLLMVMTGCQVPMR
jgi:hypothetical protein